MHSPIQPRAVAPDPAFLFYLAFLATIPLARVAIDVHGLPRLQICDVFLGVSYLAYGVKLVAGRTRLPPARWLVASGVYLAALALSVLASTHSHTRGLLKLAAYTPMVLLPCLTAALIDDAAQLRHVVVAWYIGAGVAVATGVVSILAFFLDRRGLGTALACGYGALPRLSIPRVCAPFNNPNMLANYLTITIAMVLGLVARPAWRWGAAIACGIVAAFTMSTAIAAIALAGAGVILAARRRQGRRLGAGHVLLGLGACAVAFLFSLATVSTLQPRGSGHIPIGARDLKLWDGPRPSIWAAAWSTFEKHPITGLGYGTDVAPVTDPRAFSTADQWDNAGPVAPHDMEAHNVWLSVAGQSGLVGLTAFVILVVVLLLRVGTAELPGVLAPLPTVLRVGLFAALGFHGLFAALEESRHVWALVGIAAVVGLIGAPAQRRV